MALILRFILFCIFFTIGATAIVLSVLAEEIEDYYEQRGVPGLMEADNERIRNLAAKYEDQVAAIKATPSILKNLEHITFGSQPSAEGTTFPNASPGQLSAAKEALVENVNRRVAPSQLPEWVRRCKDPNSRLTIFVAGMGLVLITFIFFGTPSRRKQILRV